MSRKLTLLVGLPVLAFSYACNDEVATRISSPPSPSFQWEFLPPPPALSVNVLGDPNQQNNSAGTFTYTTEVSGGSGSYTYRWYWRGCNMNNGEEWCPTGYFESAETGSSFTYTIGIADTRVEFAVEVQEVSGADTPASGKGYLWTAGPMFGAPGTTEGSNPFCTGLTSYPLARHVQNPSTGQWVSVDYRRNQCTGAVEYPA